MKSNLGHFRNLIVQNKIKEAVNELLGRYWKYYSMNNLKNPIVENILNDIIQISASYNDANNNFYQGLITYEDVKTTKNRLVQRFLDVLNLLEGDKANHFQEALGSDYDLLSYQNNEYGIDTSEQDTDRDLNLYRFVFLNKSLEFYETLEIKTRYDISNIKGHPIRFLSTKGRRSDSKGYFKIGTSLEVIGNGIDEDRAQYFKVKHPEIENYNVWVEAKEIENNKIDTRLFFEMEAGPNKFSGYTIFNLFGNATFGGDLREIEINETFLGKQKLDVSDAFILNFKNSEIEVLAKGLKSYQSIEKYSGKVLNDCWLITPSKRIKLNQVDKELKLVRLNSVQ